MLRCWHTNTNSEFAASVWCCPIWRCPPQKLYSKVATHIHHNQLSSLFDWSCLILIPHPETHKKDIHQDPVRQIFVLWPREGVKHHSGFARHIIQRQSTVFTPRARERSTSHKSRKHPSKHRKQFLAYVFGNIPQALREGSSYFADKGRVLFSWLRPGNQKAPSGIKYKISEVLVFASKLCFWLDHHINDRLFFQNLGNSLAWSDTYLHFSDNVKAFNHLAEYDVFPIQPAMATVKGGNTLLWSNRHRRKQMDRVPHLREDLHLPRSFLCANKELGTICVGSAVRHWHNTWKGNEKPKF